MSGKNKEEQIQIRVSKQDKERLLKLAKEQGMSLSAWLVKNSLSFPANLKAIYIELQNAKDKSYAYASLNQYLMNIPEVRWQEVERNKPENLDNEDQAYIACMVERAAALRGFTIPVWTKYIAPAFSPTYGSQADSFRLYLLINAPAVFKQRNIFIDASVGDQV